MNPAEADLLKRLKPFAVEQPARSWWVTLSTFGLSGVAAFAAATLPNLALRMSASVFFGMLLVRAFSFFHDTMHGAMFRGSRVGRAMMSLFGFLVLTPPSVWRETHNYHHAHNGQIAGSHIGSFPVMTVDMWDRATTRQRWQYRLARHPLGILCGYLTTFVFGLCIGPFLRSPRGNWGGPVALGVHGTVVAATWRFAGPAICMNLVIVPWAVATCVGSYLFYAQHNFPSTRLRERRQWTFASAAIESSSYMEGGRCWAWLTGNIGVHHVHHLNSLIPCYRLYEAMSAVPELRMHPNNTPRPSDVIACLRLSLWDAHADRMVRWPRRSST
jgi:omega-6 fatty acid desaturase (delta-12 desaturase)